MPKQTSLQRLIICFALKSDNRTIGIILCKSKRKTTVEYALQEMGKPIGVSTFTLRESLSGPLRDSLPSVEQIEMELEAIATESDDNEIDPSE